MSTVLEVQAGPGPTGELGGEREREGRCSTLLSPERAKWVHLGTLICVTLLTWALRDYSAPALRETRVIERGCSGTADPDRCAGKEAVLRVSACSAVYFLVLALWTLGVKSEREPRGDVSNGYWLLKGLGLAGLLGAAFTVVPNAVFSVYGEIARLGSALFLVFQIVMLLDRIYTWNEWLLEKRYVLPIVIVAVGAYGAAFTLVGYIPLLRFAGLRIERGVHHGEPRPRGRGVGPFRDALPLALRGPVDVRHRLCLHAVPVLERHCQQHRLDGGVQPVPG